MRAALALVALSLVGCSGDKPEDSAPPTAAGTTPSGSPGGTPTGSTPTGTTTTPTGTTTTTGTPTTTGTTCTTGIVDPLTVACRVEYLATTLSPFPTTSAFTVEYDACGRVQLLTTYEPGGATTVYSQVESQYDPVTGLLDREVSDGGLTGPPDGTPDLVKTVLYDVQDRVDAVEWDYQQAPGADCTVDHVHLDADAFEDETLDGCTQPVRHSLFTRQPDGDPLHQDIDLGNDGSVDGWNDWSYDAYDKLDTLLQLEPVSGATIRSETTWSGNLPLTLQIDNEDDGTFDTFVTYTHDPYGRMVGLVTESPAFNLYTTTTLTWTCGP